MREKEEGTRAPRAELVKARPRGIMGLVVRLVELGMAGGRRGFRTVPLIPREDGESGLTGTNGSSVLTPGPGMHPHPLAFCLLLGREGATGLSQALGGAVRYIFQD